MIKLDLQSIGTSLELHGQINHMLKMGIQYISASRHIPSTLRYFAKILVSFWHKVQGCCAGFEKFQYHVSSVFFGLFQYFF